MSNPDTANVTITDIQIQTRRNDRVNVYVNGYYRFSLGVMIAAGLRKGQSISETRLQELAAADQQSEAFQKAVRFLGIRPRSEKEIRIYLKKKEFHRDAIDRAVERLKEYNYLDDEAFARSFVDHRMRFCPRSSVHLRAELKDKGVCDTTVDQLIKAFDESDSAWNSVRRNLHRWNHLSAQEFKRKVYAFLSRKGFRYETCRNVYERACQHREDTSDGTVRAIFKR